MRPFKRIMQHLFATNSARPKTEIKNKAGRKSKRSNFLTEINFSEMSAVCIYTLCENLPAKLTIFVLVPFVEILVEGILEESIEMISNLA